MQYRGFESIRVSNKDLRSPGDVQYDWIFWIFNPLPNALSYLFFFAFYD